MDRTNVNKNGFDRRQKNKVQLEMIHGIYGKVPPQAKDMEESVLGAILVDGQYRMNDFDPWDVVSEILRPEMFYVDAHQRIFSAMQSLANKSQPKDLLSVVNELKFREELDMVGGAYFVTQLTNDVVSAANIEAHARIILQKFVQRELIRVSGEIMTKAYEDSTDPFELLDHAEESLGGVGQIIDSGDLVGIDAVLVEAVRKIEEWRKVDSSITGTPSGFAELDKATRGWQNGDLIILAARPSVGKTAFALNLIRNAAEHFKRKGLQAGNKGNSVAVWSLEMKAMMLVLRMLASTSKKLLHKIQTGRLEDSDMKDLYQNGIQVLAQLNIFFDDRPGLTIQKLRSKARKQKKKGQLGLIVVDYLQLMSADEKVGTREQEISKISRSLKNLAQELDVPVIALSQLSRDVEKRTGHNRKPQLSDLRESGSIEQDADVVLFLWGPTDEEIAEDASLLNKRYVRIAKQRNGMLVTAELNFRDEIQLFTDIGNLFGQEGNWKRLESQPDLFIQTSATADDSEDDPF